MSEAELSLINKVELRIALAESDSQLENALNVYLAPLLLKLSSPHAAVRNAILKLIQNLIPRISAARSIKLPIEALLKQVKDPKTQGNDATSAVLYSLLFISKGLDRLDEAEMRDLVPKVIENISQYPRSVSARLFNILCRLLAFWNAPARGFKEEEEMSKYLGFDVRPQDEEYLAKVISKFLLIQPNSGAIATPGLSIQDNIFFTRDAGVTFKTNQEIYAVKVSLLNFLKSGFKEQSLAIPLLIASVDGSSSIKDPNEILLKKLKVDVENHTYIETLAKLFLGQINGQINIPEPPHTISELEAAETPVEARPPNPDVTFTPPVGPQLQERIIQIFNKSHIISNKPYISDIASLGLSSDYPRLKQGAVQLIKWITMNDSNFSGSSTQVLLEFNKSMVGKLRENLVNEGWPQIDPANVKNFSNCISQRSMQYEALGNILRSNLDLIANDASHIEFLFQSLEGEAPELRSTVQDSLSNLTVHLPKVSDAVKLKIKQICRSYLTKNDQQISENENLHSCRYISVKFLNSAFPFEDSEVRLLCVLGTSKENRSDTVEEAFKGLHPYWFNQLQSSNTAEFRSTSALLGNDSEVKFPKFNDFLRHLYNHVKRVESTENASFKSISTAIQFALKVLVMQAVDGHNTVIVADKEWEVRLEKALEVDEKVRELLIKELANENKFKTVLTRKDSDGDLMVEDSDSSLSTNSFTAYLNITFNSLYGQYNNSIVSSSITYGDTFSKLLALSPTSVIQELHPLVPRLTELLSQKSVNDNSISHIAKAYGIISSHPFFEDSTICEVLDPNSFENVLPYKVRGKLLSIGYLLSRLALRKRSNVISYKFLSSYCDVLLSKIKDSSLYGVVLECITQLSIFGVLGPILNAGMRDYVNKFIDEIKPKAKKCDEKSLLTLASLTLAIDNTSDSETSSADSDDISPIEQIIYDTHVMRQVEFTFTSGEAFVILTSGWDSKLLGRQNDIQGEEVAYVPKNLTRLPIILDLVLKACANTKPSLRKSACIWLLSIVQYCGHLQVVRDKSKEAHVSFMRFLGDKDELIQESASRGLSIIYEMGDASLKETLVKGLLQSFTDTNTTSQISAGSVDHETELFDENVFKVGDASVSTYKDVLNLASDIGDPSLVYKFMSLAKSSTLWSSRKGMAFGLGSILSKSSLDELLASNKSLSSRLIPKLFRYKYDPSPSVQQSMNEIWNSLFKDSSKTITDYFEIIFEELMKGMSNKEWRTRQASTAALSDLLMLVSEDRYEQKLEKIWNMSFRVMDDIKESVRKESVKLSKVLTTNLIRMIGTGTGSKSEKLEVKEAPTSKKNTRAASVLGDLIPFLLGSKGLLSDSEDVKNFSLETILKICETNSKTLKPFIPELTGQFIVLMSSLEPEAVNYLILNADKYNLKQNDLDTQRLQSLGRSPMMDIITKLLGQIDSSIIDDVIKRLESAIKSSVGLPSKVCGSKVIIDLINSHKDLLKSYSDRLLKLSINQFKDKNDTVVSSYASSAGYLCKICSVDAVIAYSKHISELFFEGEDEKSREIASIASEYVSKYSGDRFESVASAFLPLAYIGKFDDIKSVKKNFEREWVENTTGSNYGVKLYFEEIMTFVRKYLGSSRFEIRKILSKAISDMSDKSVDGSRELIDLLIEANKGKSWDGKELVFEALVRFSINSKELLSNELEQDQGLEDRINKVVITEVKRRNKSYQKKCVKLVGDFIHHFHNSEVIETYIEIMGKVLDDKFYKDQLGEFGDSLGGDDSDDEDFDAMDIDLKSNIPSKLNIDLEEKKLDYVKNAVSSFYIEQGNFSHELYSFIFEQTFRIFHSKIIENTWRSKITVSEAISKIVGQFLEFEDEEHKIGLAKTEIDSLLKNWNQLSSQCLTSNNIENVRIQFIRLSSRLIKLLKKLSLEQERQNVLEVLQNYGASETSSVVKAELTRGFD